MADTTRIIDLTEATAPTTDMNFIVDSGEDGTKKMPLSTFLDSTLNVANKAADARATGLALAQKADSSSVPTKVSDLTNDSNFQTLTEVSSAISENIDNTLAVSGKAADAKKTGDEITALKSDLTSITGLENIPFTELNAYIDMSGSSVTMSGGVPQKSGSSARFNYACISCSRGDVFTITGEGGNQTRLWGFVASNGTILEKSDANIARTNVIITAPANAAFLILHSNGTARSYKGKKIPILLSEIITNEQMYNSIYAVSVPESILGLIDITIYNNKYSIYEKYRMKNIRHNSSWHIQLTLQGYNGTSWVGVDELEISAENAPSPVPVIEVYDSKYHRFYVTIVWALMGNSVTLTNQDNIILKNSVVNKPLGFTKATAEKALADAAFPPFELADHVDRTKVVTVKKDGSGDYTSIGAAYAAITDSTFDNQYEIIVYPGTYNENNLVPPPYTHTHGIFPMQTIVDSTGSSDVDNSVFDQANAPSKLSNMWIKSATKYCVHQDVELYGVTLVNENLYCEKLSGGSQLNSACVGMGADFGGAKFIWRGCTFINGEVGMHTNPNQDPNANQHLIFEDCTFVNAYVWLGVAGNTYGEYICEISGCKTNKGNKGTTLKCGAAISGILVNFPWQIIGGNNNLAFVFDNTSDTSVSDWWDCINTTEKKYVVATASITKGKFVSDSGTVCDASTPKQNVVGMAVASGSSGNVVPVWSGAIPYTGTAGEYGIDANGELSASASIKIGYVFNNIFYPY